MNNFTAVLLFWGFLVAGNEVYAQAADDFGLDLHEQSVVQEEQKTEVENQNDGDENIEVIEITETDEGSTEEVKPEEENAENVNQDIEKVEKVENLGQEADAVEAVKNVNQETETIVEVEESIVEKKGEDTADESVTEVVSEALMEDNNDELTDVITDGDDKISFYIHNLNLSVEQLDLAKYISDESRLRQEQLLKSISLLRQQARDLEKKSLDDFESILNEEQLEKFHKLRKIYEKENIKEGKLDELISENAKDKEKNTEEE